MKLEHNDGWNIPASDPCYPALPAVYRNVQRQLVFFETAPLEGGRVLPEPLEASDSGLCVAAGVVVPYSSSYGTFEESFLMLECRFRGRSEFYCSHVFHNRPAGIAAGREIYGTPKVYADLNVQRDGAKMRTKTVYDGSPILAISSETPTVAESAAVPVLAPGWRLKIIPRADGPGPALCTNVMRDVTHHQVLGGSGTVTLGKSPSCDLTPLAPQRYGEAFCLELILAIRKAMRRSCTTIDPQRILTVVREDGVPCPSREGAD